MPNFARDKKVLEPAVARAGVVTNGQTTGGAGGKGCASFAVPGTLTVDLEKIYRVGCVRVLLGDGCAAAEGRAAPRRYRYRLAVSTDTHHWHELYTTPEAGTAGWQVFRFRQALRLRYVRLYGLWAAAPHRFEVVEVEAHDACPPAPEGPVGTDVELPEAPPPPGNAPPAGAPRIDGAALNKLIATLEDSPIDPALVQDIKARFEDLIVLDQNLEAIRREIVDPVTGEMRKSNHLAVVALGLTIIGLVLTLLVSPGGARFFDAVRRLFTA